MERVLDRMLTIEIPDWIALNPPAWPTDPYPARTNWVGRTVVKTIFCSRLFSDFLHSETKLRYIVTRYRFKIGITSGRYQLNDLILSLLFSIIWTLTNPLLLVFFE